MLNNLSLVDHHVKFLAHTPAALILIITLLSEIN